MSEIFSIFINVTEITHTLLYFPIRLCITITLTITLIYLSIFHIRTCVSRREMTIDIIFRVESRKM